jgi:hypothetical protein
LLRLKKQMIEFESNPRIPEAKIFDVLLESRIDADRATFEELFEALTVYRKRFPQFEKIGVKGDRWETLRRDHFEELERDAAHRKRLRKARYAKIRAEWERVRTTPTNPKIFDLVDAFERLKAESTPNLHFYADFDDGGAPWSAEEFGVGLKLANLAADAGQKAGESAGVMRNTAKEWAAFWECCVWLYLHDTGKRNIFVGSEAADGGMVNEPLAESINLILWLKLNCGITGTSSAAISGEIPLDSVSNVDGKLKKRRGRPTKISDELKEQALQAMAMGKTNNDASKILYNTSHPTVQQVKNVPSLLRKLKRKKEQELSGKT